MIAVSVSAFLISSSTRSIATSLSSTHLRGHELSEIASAGILDGGGSYDPTVLLSTADIVVGSILALALAAFVSCLKAQSINNDVVLPSEMQRFQEENSMAATNSTEVGDKSLLLYDWNEMKRPEDYILYTTTFRQRKQQKNREVIDGEQEQKWVAWALLFFFVPIFTFEIFLTTSRQVVCRPTFLDVFAVARFLCSPYDAQI